jgi:hypothetical protein
MSLAKDEATIKARVQIPTEPTRSARYRVITPGKLCTRICSGQLSLLPFAGCEMSTGFGGETASPAMQ